MNNAVRCQLLRIIGLVWILPSTVFAHSEWPGRRPPTLDEHWDSELIVFTKVVETALENGCQSSRHQILTRIKTPKQQQIPDEIKVIIPLGSHWPYTFREGQHSVAFLKFDKERESYVAQVSGNAGHNVDQETGEFYLKQYAKLPKILKEKDAKKRLDLKREWYVEFALFPQTRYEAARGIRILWTKAKEQKLIMPKDDEFPSDWLTDSQKQRICQPFANEPPNASSYDLLKLLALHPSPIIDDYLLKSLRLSLENEDEVPVDRVRISELAFRILPDRIGFELPQQLASGYEEFRELDSDYTYNISIGEEYSDADRKNARTALVKKWRNLAREFLKIPELEKIATQ